MSNSIDSNRSTLKEFLASIATIQGDLSNITAPPFVLGEFSTVEIPQYWGDHPSLFVAPALAKDEVQRALLVLKWFLGSLKNQQYAGRKEEDGVKKPLNAFLGELFLGSWQNENVGETKLVAEQVSHHPPVTACCLWNDKHGIRAQGFTQQEINFSGSVSIKQKGYAILHIDQYEEDYLIPVPNVKVKGILTGTPYPELVSDYSIVSSTGIVSEIKFEGKSLLGIGGGSKNGFQARTYRSSAPQDDLYTAKGSWNGSFSIHDANSGQTVDEYNIGSETSHRIMVLDRMEQDPWESRRAWGGVVDALQQSDMKGTTDAKSKVEEGQRQMRRDEQARSEDWQRVFFRKVDSDPLFDKLSSVDKDSFVTDPKGGIWKFDMNAFQTTKKPYHGDIMPTGEHLKGGEETEAKEEQHFMQSSDGLQIPEEISQEKIRESGTIHREQTGGPVSTTYEIQDTHVEAMLRAKYQSAPR